MAKVEAEEQTRSGQEIGDGHASAQTLIGISGPVDFDRLKTTALQAVSRIVDAGGAAEEAASIAIAYPSYPGMQTGMENGLEVNHPAIRLLPYDLQGAINAKLPWLGQTTAYEAIFRLAQTLRASACVVLNPDLAALRTDALGTLAAPVLNRECDLVMPLYPVDRYEGLLNLAILAPLTQALYGKRVRFPLAQDFAVSADLLPFMHEPVSRRDAAGQMLLWPATEAAVRDRKLCQVHLDVHHVFSSEGVELSAVLAQVVGPLFAEMERHAAPWQRVRGSTETVIAGPAVEVPADGPAMDARPMIDAFLLGYRNLQDVWGLVLPPVTLLELKHLSRQTPDAFKMSDALWARIVYDFALAHRLRTLGRNHLLGALTPLYLGWVASYVGEVRLASDNEVELRRERLARAFEEAKPYLVQRWRWPDRFNP